MCESHRPLKDALCAHCATVNWVDHFSGFSWASAQQPGRTTAPPPPQAVFSSPLILPGQFLDSPELPSKFFLYQFSKTLSAAEHTSTKHNTVPARQPPLQLPDDLAFTPTVFMRRDGHVPPLQPLYDGPYAIIRHSLHHFTLCIGDKEDKVSTLCLKPCTDPTAPPCAAL